MGIKRPTQARIISLLIVAFTIFLLFRHTSTASISDPVVGENMADTVASKLKVSVRQTSSSPPKLAIGVTNTLSEPVTILSWNSPLDPLALQLGLLSFIPAGSDGPVEIPKIQVRRQMPPGRESFMKIEAGQTKEQELELREPIVPLEKLGGRVSVVCKGYWLGVWPSSSSVLESVLEEEEASEGASRGSFESQVIYIEI
ncbi:hypothetical protein F4779DRAFT_411716 [Xylariaceae sp. FL0662B]|nr:hypothetical protein F4779DRAFT_411716 [Xylariaceae sp. FL0662B]